MKQQFTLNGAQTTTLVDVLADYLDGGQLASGEQLVFTLQGNGLHGNGDLIVGFETVTVAIDIEGNVGTLSE